MVDVIKLKTGERDIVEGSDGPLGGKIKEICSVLRMAYEAGRAKGREEARRELLGSLETPRILPPRLWQKHRQKKTPGRAESFVP